MLDYSYFEKIDISDGVKLPILSTRSILMTRVDVLRERSEELKPKIMEYLKKQKNADIFSLMKLLDADILEMKYAIEALKKEGKIVAR